MTHGRKLTSRAPHHACRNPIGWVLCAAIAVLMPSLASADVADYLGKPVVSVRLQAEDREVADPLLAEVVETRVGMPLSILDGRESVTDLFSFGRFEDVRVRAAGTAGGVALLYDLVPVHPVDRVVFRGTRADGIDTKALRRSVLERNGASPPIGRASDLARILEDQLS